MPFCSNCGSKIEENVKFCPNCGTPQIGSAPTVQQAPAVEEKAFFTGEGELIVKRTKHHGAGRKVASWLALGPLGYVAFGRDKTRKTKAKGKLVITNKAIYCAGNDYPFDMILSVTKQGMVHKSIVLAFEKSFSEPGTAGMGGMSVEVELKTESIDQLFKALEEAKMQKIKF